MQNKIVTVVLLLLVLPALTFAQVKKNSSQKAVPYVLDQKSSSTYTSDHAFVLPDGNYVLIDSMANAFGPAIGDLNPVAFDPYSGLLAWVHRGAAPYATGSGELWYNVSTDFGLTWTRVSQAVNGSSTQKTARYPSMWISNPTKGDVSATTAFFAYPVLEPGAGSFGWLGYAADQPAGSGNTNSFLDEATLGGFYSSNVPCWADDITPRLFWLSNFSANTTGTPGAGVALFSTEDFVNITKSIPPEWSDTAFSSNGQYAMGGVAYKGIQYAGFFGPFTSADSITPPMSSGWYAGYSKSTDNGATWSRIKPADWRNIPRLAKYDRLFDYKPNDGNVISLQGDIMVDKNERVHLCISIIDTLTGPTDGTAAVVDLFETETGAWDGYVVYEGLNWQAYQWGPGLGQMGPSTYIAMDSTRSIIGVQWVNSGTGDANFADIYFAYRTLNDTVYSTPQNLTNSPNINNSQSHLAPFMQATVNGDNVDVVAFSYYGYVSGATGPFSDTINVTNGYGARVPFTVVNPNPVGVFDNNVVNNFNLAQNYPNPFNPSTKIDFSIAERSNVTLKIYDLLGREVASLVNGQKEAGKYSIPFNASKLASGLYIYTLKAGSNSISKKMMLLK